MRPLEGLLVAALIVALFMRWQQPRNRQVTATLLAMLGILTALHVFFDGARWEMIPAYLMAIAAAWIFFRDLQRVSGAKAGESSRWAAVPSTGQRALRGTLLGIAAILAVAIPLWAFPRIAMPDLDGYYDVGRMDVTLTDAARSNRSIAVTLWYPAEVPNGRVLRYHPEPGVLGSSLAHGSPLPGFAFRNLTAAKTHSTLEPRFNLREGRSPIILASHDAGGSRYEGTGLYEHLASNGYIVASVGGDGSDTTVNVGERTADLAFVLERLVSLPAGGSAIDTLNTHVRTDRIAMIGRGVGAAAVLDLAATEPRVTAVVAIAPRELTATARNGVRRPFLAFTVGQPIDGLDDAFRYGGTEARLEGATDATLSDRALLGSPVVSLLGIESGDDPRDVHAAVSALTLRFLDQYLKDRREQTEVDLPSRVRVTMVPHPPR